MKLQVKKCYVLNEFYKHGISDDFNYFYYRNHKVFNKNSFYEAIDIESFYDDEKYPKVETALKKANLIMSNCFVLPEGIHDLTIIEEIFGGKTYVSWEVKIGEIILSNISNLLDETRFGYNAKIKEYLEIIDN